jgi:hypothetical protein
MSTFFASYPIEGGGGVTSINGLSGALTLVGGTGITVTNVGNTITISSTSAGDVTLTPFGSTPNADAASLSGQALTLQPADNSNPGGISLFAQTLGAGDKTFPGNILTATDATYDIGTSSTRFNNGWFANSTTVGSKTTGTRAFVEAFISGSSGMLQLGYNGSWSELAYDGVELLGIDSFGFDTFSFANAGTPSYKFFGSSNTAISTLTNTGLTLTGTITASNFSGSSSGTNTGDVTIGTANGLSIASGQILSLALATGSSSGAVLNVGSANGVATLDSSGKIPIAQLPASVFIYQGVWDPNTNTPTLADGTGTTGFVYWVSAARLTAVPGLNNASMVNFQIGDLVIYNGTQYELTTPAAGVQSVNGSTGAVTVNAINQLTGDGTAGPASGSASAALTLANVNSNVGSFTYASITVNGKGLITAASSGSAPTGTVTSVSVVSSNGLAGTVATSTTTPAITLSTTVTGILQGNGTAISAATTTGTGNVVLSASPTLTGTIAAGALTLTTPLAVASGGTGVATIPAYAVITGGTTTTGAIQTVAAGSTGQFLTYQGSAALPTWSTGLANPMSTAGDMIYGGASGTPTRLTAGTSGQVPISAGTTVAFGTLPGNSTALKAATVQVFTTGTSQTYTPPSSPAPLYIEVTMVGGGGGGAGSGTTPGAATAGTASTFSTFSGGGGGLGSNTPGAGGTSSGGSVNLTGGTGGAASGSTIQPGGVGGISFFGGAGPGGSNNGAGAAAAANTGSGGGGAGDQTTTNTGSGGGAGGYCWGILASSTYTYSVGLAGSAGTAGTSGQAGGAGARGIIIVKEHYQ